MSKHDADGDPDPKKPGKKIDKAVYEAELFRLQTELVKLQEWTRATGARIVGKAAALLKREGGSYALATQCIGGGQGIATVLEAAE